MTAPAEDPRSGEACEAFTECVVGNISHHTHSDAYGRCWCCQDSYPYTAPTPPECDPERVETVARALWAAGWSDSTKHGPQYASFDAFMEHLARAAIAALPPSPAEEAVKRQSAAALCDLSFQVVGRYVAEPMRSAIAMEVNRCVLPAALGITEDELRAALASPAPAPQGEPCGVDPCDCDHPSHDERAKTAAACRRFNQKLIDGAR